MRPVKGGPYPKSMDKNEEIPFIISLRPVKGGSCPKSMDKNEEIPFIVSLRPVKGDGSCQKTWTA
ncbi:MAG: hypothetical protein QM683_18730 [Lacrimispora sp.]